MINSQVVIYHNPRCSKSRATLKILQDHGIQPKIVEYLKTPLNGEEINELLDIIDPVSRRVFIMKYNTYDFRAMRSNRAVGELMAMSEEHVRKILKLVTDTLLVQIGQ